LVSATHPPHRGLNESTIASLHTIIFHIDSNKPEGLASALGGSATHPPHRGLNESIIAALHTIIFHIDSSKPEGLASALGGSATHPPHRGLNESIIACKTKKHINIMISFSSGQQRYNKL
jgi:hypothetical protein